MRTAILAVLLYAFSARAGVVDRVAVVVGDQVMTESEVDEEVRITEFENQEALDLSAAKRRAAAERLVDQQLIRNEMQLERFQAPASNGAALLQDFRREDFPSEARFEAALHQYGISQAQIEQHLVWQAAALRFVDFRFRGPQPATAQSANRSRPGAGPTGASEDPQLDAWLKQARAQTHIEFKKEAFE